MKHLLPRYLWGTLLILFGSLQLHAVNITGPAVVCKNSTVPYSLSGTIAGNSYKWTMTNAVGTLANIYGTTNNVYWSLPGNTVLKVVGYNSLGVAMDSNTKAVTVKPLPQPMITTDFKVACQNFQNDSTKEGQHPPANGTVGPLFLDDGPCVKVCEDSWVTYTATGDPGSTFTWTISGGTPTTANGSTINVHWGAIGMGSISVTETTVNGCTGTRTGCIEIIGKPHALFGAMPNVKESIEKGYIVVCLKQDVIFVDQSYATSSSPIVSWLWDFGDGHTYNTSTTANPVHHYDHPGTYDVTLTVKNACNCTDVFRLRVEVMPEEGLRIVCASVVCEGSKDESKATYSLGDLSIPCGDYLWSVTGGTILSSMPYGPTIDVAWDNVDDDGFGYVHFDAAKCDGVKCPGITTIKIPVIKQKGVIKGPVALCPDNQYKYTLPAWPGTVYNWTLSNPGMGYLSHTDQPNEIVVHTYSGGGGQLICSYTNSIAGCKGNASLFIKILPGDGIVGDETVCQNSNVTYHLGSGNAADWVLTAPDGSTTNFSGATSPMFSFPQVGLYSLNATGAFCLPSPLSIRVLGTPSAVNSITGPDTVCVNPSNPIPYEFTAGNAVPGTFFQWQIIGGTALSPLSGKKITVAFTGTGIHQVIVHRVGTQAPYCVGPDLVKTLYTPVIPIAINGKDTVCPNVVEHYTGGYGGGDAYEWTLSSNAGSIDDNKQPNVNITWNNYSTPTLATIQLRITKCGRDTLKTFNVVIMPSPVLSLGNDVTICSGLPLNVNLTSSPALNSGTLTWYVDGVAVPPPVTLPGSLSHVFNFLNTTTTNTSTIRNINVIVTSPNGCLSSATLATPKKVTVLPAPVALVTPIGPIVHCGAFPAETLTATVQGGLGGPFTYSWSNGPATQSISTNQYGSYYVTVTGSNGCSSASNVVNIVQNCGNPTCTIVPAPVTGTSVTQHCGQATVNLTYSTTNYTGAPVAIGLPPTGTLVPPVLQSPGSVSVTATFPTAGSYDFSFGIPYYDVNSNVCVKTVNQSVVIPLMPELFYQITCVNGTGYKVKLMDHSNHYPGTSVDSFHFYLDSPSPVQTGTADTWSSPGSVAVGLHNAKMTVYFTFNGVSDSCSATRAFTLDSLPVASFTFGPNNACVEKQAIQFTSTSTGTISGYNWDFKDFSGILQQNPIKVYQVAGSYNVTLTVSNAYGCTSMATKTVVPVNNPLLGAISPNVPITICEGSTTTLVYGPVSPFANRFTWMKESNALFTSTTNSFAVNQSGSYWVRVTDTLHGCWQNTKPPVSVAVVAVPDPIITGDSLQCVDNKYSLFGYAGNAAGIAYQWKLNGSNYSTQPNLIDEMQSSPGTYTYQLIITITQGSTVCSKTSSAFKVIVSAPPMAPTVSFNVLNCDPYQIELTANPNMPGTYNWSNGTSGNPIISSIGGPFKVWYTDNSGCTVAADAVSVPKDPKGYLWIFPTGCYTKCPPIQIPGPIIPFVKWAWYHPTPPAIISSGTNSLVTPLNLYSSGYYGMFLDNGYCTANIDTLDLTVPKDCKATACDKLKLSLFVEGNCNQFMYLTLDNGYGTSLPYTIGVNIGAITTTGGTLPSGVSYLYPNWTPPPGFTGGTLIFYITLTLPDGRTCTSTIETYVRCGYSYRGTQGSGVREGTSLTVAPNPAQQNTVIAYRFATQANEGSNRTVEVYDVTGRKLAAHNATEQASGNWTLKLDAFAPGIYQIVLKEGGTVVETTRLSVTR